MGVFQCKMPGIEVNGQTVLSVVAGMVNQDFARKILADNGIKEVKPEGWYPQQAWLDAFKAISEKIGPVALSSIGRKIPESAQWPPQVNSIETALSSIDIAYHMNHRLNGAPMFDPKTGAMKEGIGHYKAAKTGTREVTVTCDNPYPCEFDKGIITAAAKKFKPADVASIVLIEDEKACRMSGGGSCVYKVTW